MSMLRAISSSRLVFSTRMRPGTSANADWFALTRDLLEVWGLAVQDGQERKERGEFPGIDVHGHDRGPGAGVAPAERTAQLSGVGGPGHVQGGEHGRQAGADVRW